jgi:hypothetical protein
MAYETAYAGERNSNIGSLGGGDAISHYQGVEVAVAIISLSLAMTRSIRRPCTNLVSSQSYDERREHDSTRFENAGLWAGCCRISTRRT